MILVEEISPTANGWWLQQPFFQTQHVIPLDDAGKHELDCGCWCTPVLSGAVVAHRAIVAPSVSPGTVIG